MQSNLPSLTPRLAAIASLVPKGVEVADIGTDHAYIPAYLVNSGKSPFAVAADILPGPLKRARETIAKYNCGGRVEARLSDGLSAIAQNEVDCVIIAGMGGVLISEILTAGYETAETVKHFILQPMTAAHKLRRYLYENNFTILREVLVQEGNKIYVILYCAHGKEKISDDVYLYLSRALIDEKPPLFCEYVGRMISGHVKKLNGLKRGLNPQNGDLAVKTERLIKKLKELKDNAKMQ